MDPLKRHQHIALQVSGGRDSLACLYLLREHLDKITVYWLNTGNAFPETLEVIEHVKSMAPRFVEIAGNQPAVVARHGIPSDLVPRTSTPFGNAIGQSSLLLQDSYSCCYRVVMEPMHRRMLVDDITLIIRGQRADDGHRSPLQSGDSEYGIEYLFPVEGWTAHQVDAYLAREGAPRLRFYDHMETAPDCMNCTGWWAEGRGEYLRQFHPEHYERYREALALICSETMPHIESFTAEIEGRNQQ